MGLVFVGFLTFQNRDLLASIKRCALLSVVNSFSCRAITTLEVVCTAEMQLALQPGAGLGHRCDIYHSC